MKNTIIISISILIMASVVFSGCGSQTSGISDVANLLTEVKTTQFFTDDPVSDADIEMILSAGVNAPSAMNTQPWHFTAVTNPEIASKLASAMGSMKPPFMGGDSKKMPPEGFDGIKNPPEGMPKDAPKPPAGAPENMPTPPQGKEGFSKATNKAGIGDAPLTIVISCNTGSELDAGLAVQNMSAEAQLLGYGTKIMTAPTMALNTDEYKEMLNIPEGQKISAVLIVGKAKTDSDAISGATTRNPFDEVVTIMK